MTRYFPAIFVVLWSTGFIGARLGMPYAEPMSFLSLRYLIAFLILFAMAMVMRAPWPGLKVALHSMVVGFLLHGVYLGAVFWAIDRGLPAGVSAMIVGLQPLAVAVFAGLILKETISRNHWLGLGVGVIGLVLVIAPKIEFGDHGISPVNIAVVIGAMLASTFGTIYQKKFAADVPLRTGTVFQYAGALIPSLAYAFLFETFTFQWNGELIFALVWLVIVLSIISIFLLLILIREGSVARVASLLYLVPASTAIIAYFLFGETLNWIQLMGMMMCAAGVKMAMAKGPSAT
ncbi:MAG TPA: DMT family transporter [Devosia sp.]|nr:DMT family transporter [Devosia sp.]